ncbi:MAG: hypothetical protein U0997_06695 [Sulfurimicrobium sp.]|nr:hypothetical protein [Sulfurimicrobium sp.]
MEYTPAQIRLYLEAISREEKRRQRDQLWLMRAARANDKGFKKALEALD